VQSYIDRVGQLFKRADVSIVPSELAKMQGFFEGIETVSQTVNNKPNSNAKAGS
jgi:hypothetical protein